MSERSTMGWHAPTDLLVQYARTPEALDASSAASLEAHLLACATCRATVATSADPSVAAASWAEIADVIDRPRAGVLDRLLGAFGMSSAIVRPVAATRQLRAAWLAAVGACAVSAVWLSQVGGSPGPFLAIAPLVPVLAVWLSFAPIAEPAGEAGVAAPLAGPGLVLRRVLAAGVPALAVVAVSAAAVPDAARAAGLWLLPGLALAAGTLALATAIRVASAVGGLVLAWCALIAVATLPSATALADSALFGPAGQLGALSLAGAAVAVCWRRRNRFATLVVTW